VVGFVTISNREKHLREVLQKVLDEADRILGSFLIIKRSRLFRECFRDPMSPANHRHERVGEEIAHEINAMLAGGELKESAAGSKRGRQRSARPAGHEARAGISSASRGRNKEQSDAIKALEHASG